MIRSEIWAVFPRFGGRINLPIMIYTWCLAVLWMTYGGLDWDDYPFIIFTTLLPPPRLSFCVLWPATYFPVSAHFFRSWVDFLSLNSRDSHVHKTKHAFKALVSVEADTDTHQTHWCFQGRIPRRRGAETLLPSTRRVAKIKTRGSEGLLL